MSEIEGLSELQRQLKKLGNSEFTNALFAGGRVLRKKGMENSPVDTGALKRSYKLKEVQKNEIELEVDVFYSSIVEFRQPYLRPVIDRNEALILKAVVLDVQKIINKAVK